MLCGLGTVMRANRYEAPYLIELGAKILEQKKDRSLPLALIKYLWCSRETAAFRVQTKQQSMV